MIHYSGAIHIHSFYSFDGSKKIDYLTKTAKKCGLDYIIINDHFSIEAKKYEGWHDDVLVIVGEEISPRYNHYLAFNIKEPIAVDRDYNNPQTYIDEVNKQGGFGFIAHPDHAGNKKFGVKDYRWSDWKVKGYTGFCIWDLQNDWQITLKGYPSALLSYLFPARYLRGPKKETLKRWDELNQNQADKKYAIGEIDNHESARRYFGLNFYIFPFEFAFRTIRTHILLNEPFSKDNSDIIKVYNAIKNGNTYISNDFYHNAKGFEFYKENNHIKVKTPVKSVIRIIKNGKNISEVFSDTMNIEISGKGCYRCECYLKKYGLRPWIFSNPIFV
ncbi:MAG: hypothetical protein A2474_04025 [Elusimicrobia bacterium RIFOXYC2_FULL_34_12]|nr:MAG: hypothetical protein A2474_04025 [Elusimicrobia bacterium RIFOXYC2_FULL_34_12]OGS38979.1 MAG: hypothetical protein A2551_01170 [Elusimicrobia bacterium RIFOXYD2_FULL_34_30]HAM38919.1 hypothetical protein [Elusimicrobiota bacterium]